MRSAFDFTPFRRSAVGFDRLFDMLENSGTGQGQENYPPFDLIKLGDDVSYFLGRERLIPTGKSRMARWRKSLFAVMSRNARSATEFFNIPPNRVVELGTQIEF